MDDFLLVHKSLLPSDIDLILKAIDLVQINKYSISKACEETHISRTRFYKYKDLVKRVDSTINNKANIEIKVIDEKGLLSNILAVLSKNNTSIIKINQESPRQNTAFINILFDVSNMKVSLDKLIDEIENIKGVLLVNLLALD